MPEPDPIQGSGSYDPEPNPLTVAGYIGAFIFLGVMVVFFHDSKTIALIWAGACLATGATVGFLFGIPRTLQQEGKATPEGGDGSYAQRVNTNLEQISDWLTKILVGLGLTQLQKIPGKLQDLAGYMAEGTGNNQSERVFAAGLIVYFSVVGFIGGYLLTRLILARLFRKADTDPVTKQVRQLQQIAGTGSSAASSKAGAADLVRATAITLKAYDDLESKVPIEILKSHIQELEDLKGQFPLYRMLFIVLARLYRWTGQYDKAIEVLTTFVDAKKKDGSDGDEDTATALYNRACYYAQKIPNASLADASELASKAIADLKAAITRKKDYAVTAQKDTDLDPIRQQPELQAAIGQSG